MAAVGRGQDALALALTGGASNGDPAASLGGAASSRRLLGMGFVVAFPDKLAAVRVDEVSGLCGEGSAKIATDAAGYLSFAAPGEGAGSPVSVPAGTAAVLPSSTPDKYARVFVEVGLALPISRTLALTLVRHFNGPFAGANVASAQRAAGAITYRAVAILASGIYPVRDVRLWLPYVPRSQAKFALGLEYPAAFPGSGPIQSIADETHAPLGVAWSAPVDEAGALVVPEVPPGTFVGLWVRRTFPAGGFANPEEDVRISYKFKGA